MKPEEVRAPVAFFDVDHTLFAGNAGSFLAIEMYRSGLLSLRDIARMVWWNVLYKVGRLSEGEVWRHSLQRIVGMEDSALRTAAARAYAGWIRPRVYAEALAEVERQRLAGATLVLVSAAPRPVVDLLAAELGIATAHSAWPTSLDGRIASLDGVRLMIGDEKGRVVEEECARLGVAPSDCWAYGDSANDVPMLAAVGHPVAVNPRRALRAVATERGWEVRTWTRRALGPEWERHRASLGESSLLVPRAEG